jgi:hypothetical protein
MDRLTVAAVEHPLKQAAAVAAAVVLELLMEPTHPEDRELQLKQL